MMERLPWKVHLIDEVSAWMLKLSAEDPDTADRIEEALGLLRDRGPDLGRPFVDRIKGSRFHNMKELRPASSGASEVRMLFAFDPAREAVFVVAGDKAGQWQRWYREAVPLADDRYAEHLRMLEESDS